MKNSCASIPPPRFLLAEKFRLICGNAAKTLAAVFVCLCVPALAPAEKVGWLDGEHHTKPGENEEYKIKALAEFKKNPFWKILPPDVKQAVEQNKENYDFDSGPAKDGDFINNNISVDRIKGSYAVQVLRWDLMTFLDAPEASSPLNPKTGQYYVMPPKESFEGLSEADLDYVKKLTERVNRNIHYLGHSPIPRIDPAKMRKGAYVTTSILPLTLFEERDFLSKTFMKANKTTQEEFRTFLELEDEVDFELAKRLGVPLYHPERFKPENLIKPYRTCWGVPQPMAGHNPLVRPISLGWSPFITKPEFAYKWVYYEYFEALKRSAKLFQKGLEAEKALHTTDAKAAAVQTIVKQAGQYAAKIEKEADKYAEQSDKIYKKPPRSILDPSGSVLNKFLKKQKARAAAAKQD